MKATGIIRKIDDLGRVVIPKEIRKQFNIIEGDPIEIFLKDDKIILKKYDITIGLSELIRRLDDEFQNVRNDIEEEAASQIYGHIKDLQKILSGLPIISLKQESEQKEISR